MHCGAGCERQLARLLSPRRKRFLVNQCLRANAAYDDPGVSPVVRQTLLHWAYELTETDFRKMAGV